jgi:16S rRNA (cytosine967-C5)-methyltransferase
VAAERTVAPDALRLPAGTAAESWPEFAQGLFEVQDTGSQLACAALAVQPGESVIDLCAGAGGKTLALAAALENRGHLLACDIDRPRLSRLPERAARAEPSRKRGCSIRPRGGDAGRLGGQGGCRADRCALFGHGHLAAQSRGALAVVAQRDRTVRRRRRACCVAADLVRPGGRLTLSSVRCSMPKARTGWLRSWPKGGLAADLPTMPAGRARGGMAPHAGMTGPTGFSSRRFAAYDR